MKKWQEECKEFQAKGKIFVSRAPCGTALLTPRPLQFDRQTKSARHLWGYRALYLVKSPGVES